MNTVLLGDKFYRKINDKLEIIRIIRVKNENTYMCKNQNINTGKLENEKRRILRKELADNYTKIKPHGFVSFSIVELSNGFKDVMVALTRAFDIDNKILTPYAVCRQCCLNPFTQIIIKEPKNYVGVSINKDNVPADIDFNLFLSCNKVKNTSAISIYIDDNIEDILSILNRKNIYDNTLLYIKNQTKDMVKFIGYQDSISKLLSYNDFMFDFYMGFHIKKVDFEMKIEGKNYSLIPELKIKLEDIIRKPIETTCVTKYDYTIDLDKIERQYVLIKDSKNNLYVVAFTTNDGYINYSYNAYVPDKLELKHHNEFIKSK